MNAAYMLEAEDLDRLRRIAQRLGDMQALTHDQRRDLMNELSLVVSNAHLFDADRLDG